VEYDNVGGASSDEAKELLAFAKELRLEILSLLQKNHPDLL
jgi:hypothetical protein